MFRPRRVDVIATRYCPSLLTALVLALEKSGFYAAIDPPGGGAEDILDVRIGAETIRDAGLVPGGAGARGVLPGAGRADADFLVLVLRDDPASLTEGFMALKAKLGARGPNAMPCSVALLIDESTTPVSGLQAHRSLNRAAKRFLRLDLIHCSDLAPDGATTHAVARSLARRIGAKLRLHQSTRPRSDGALRASG